MTKTRPLKLSEMEVWQVNKAAIGGRTKAVAHALRRSVSTVEKWQREIASDENPDASGEPSPVDRVEEYLTALWQECGEESLDLIVDHIRMHAAKLKGYKHRQNSISPEFREQALAMRNELNRMVLEKTAWDREVENTDLTI
ncbi:MAG TPA: hypothetical protein VNQ79_05335 [Blastocatellia bacterium]|nr:hypothetical protein [Blastocatellia bacterium]